MSTYPSERVVVARHPTADGEIQLQKRQRPDGSHAYEIIADGVFLMASYNHVSERALAERVLPSVLGGAGAKRRVLIGGLGMGYTLQAALNFDVTAVDAVELNPHIVDWNSSHFAPLNGSAVTDPRVTIIADDLFAAMNRAPEKSYCAILLDVDNGPSWLAHPRNERLYTSAALMRWSARLTPGGIFAVWSAQPEPAFNQRMAATFDAASETIVVANDVRDEPTEYFIYHGVKRER